MVHNPRQDWLHSGSTIKDPRWTYWGIGLLLMIVVLPYERLVGPASLRLVDAVIVLLVLYTAVSSWRSRQRLVFPLLLPMWLIIMSSLVASLLGFAYMTNFMAILQEVYLWILLVVVTNLLLRHNAIERDRLLKLWALVACVIALTTIMGMLHIGPSMFYEIPQRTRYQFEGFDRGVGTYINPNAAAAYLSSSFFIAIGAPLPKWVRLLPSVFGFLWACTQQAQMGRWAQRCWLSDC